MLTTKTLTIALAMLLTTGALAAEPPEGAAATEANAQLLSSLSAAAVIDAKLLPAARSGIASQAKTWHRTAQQRLAGLHECAPGRQAVACLKPPAQVAERISRDDRSQRSKAGGGLAPRAVPAALEP